MATKLVRHTHVIDDKHQVHEFAPGAKVPAWARKLITNPKVWAKDEEDGDEPSGDDNPAGGGSDEVPAVPPKSGSGSGRNAWVAYAEANGVEVSEDMSREDIVEALEAAEVPTST